MYLGANVEMLPPPHSIENKENFHMLKAPKPILLTPSSSDISLPNSVTNALQCTQRKQLAPQSTPAAALPPYLTLKRQQSAAMLNFRARKSLSQMDFKEARRTGNYQLVAHVPSTKALMPSAKQQTAQDSQLTIKDDSLAQLLLQDAAQLCSARQGNVRFVVNGDQDVRIASLRIFNTIMLRSWRRRRQEVRHLSEQVEDFKRNVSTHSTDTSSYVDLDFSASSSSRIATSCMCTTRCLPWRSVAMTR